MKDITTVLTNWLREARDTGSISAGAGEAEFVAEHLVKWLRHQCDETLGDAELAAESIDTNLRRLPTGGDRMQDELMHELAHLREALALLRMQLGLIDDTPN